MASPIQHGNIFYQAARSFKSSLRYADLETRPEQQSVDIDEQKSNFPGSLLPMVLIALVLWAVIIAAGIWLFHHVRF